MDPMMPPTPSHDGPPSGPPDWEQLDAYFAGELDRAAEEAVRRYLERNPEVERTFRRPSAFVPPEHAPNREVDVATMWRAMERRIGQNAPTRGATSRPVSRGTWWTRYAASVIASVAAAAVLVGVWQWRTHANGGRALVAAEYATLPGQRADIHLADGSSVLLGPASRLRTRVAGHDVRDVMLDGEAYFTVHGRSGTPFVVHAGDGIVRVLGTAFSVRRYPEDSAVRVAVTSGRVGLRARTDSDGVGVVLGASDVAQLGPRNLVLVTRGANLDDDLSWRTGQLRFHNTPVSSVLADVRRMYDLDVTVRDSTLASLPVTITLHETTANGVLDVLSRLLNVDIRREGRHVTLVPQTSR
jgi:ferric-dicitrate binding protein FerR (iron transport regulator)